MDDTQKQNQPVQNTPVQQGSMQAPQNQQPAQPVSGGPKEKAAMPSSQTQEWIAPSTPEVQIPKELEGHMEATPIPTIPQDIQNAGVTHAKEATPVTVAGEEALGLTTSPSVLATLKKAHSNVKDSIRWLVELVGLAQRKRDRDIEKGGKE